MKIPPAAARLLACLGDPSRFFIVRVLSSGRRCVTELALDVGLSQSCTTRHLQALERAGLVHGTREGRRVTFGLTQDQVHVADLIAWALRHESEVVEIAAARTPRVEGARLGRTRRARRPRPRDSKVNRLPAEVVRDRVDISSSRVTDDPGPSATPGGVPPGRFEDLEDFLL